jgi:hypothetical protein
MRDAHLIRIIRNKRLPLSERYASLMIYQGQINPPADLSDETIDWELKLLIQEMDRKPL